MSRVFLTTRYTDDIYQYIVSLCVKDTKLKKKNLKIQKIRLGNMPDLFFLIVCLKYLLLGKFWSREKTVSLTYKNINFGKKLLSTTFRSFESYVSTYKFYYNLFKNIYTISKIFKTAKYYEKNFDFNHVYLDHIEYLNGIYFEIFKDKKRTFYTNCYPNNINKTKKKNLETIQQINFVKKKRYTKKQKKIIFKAAKKVFGSINDFLPWMQTTKWSSIKNKDLKKYDYIVYAHSFTDSQLAFGFDGFANTLEWLEFTIKELQKKKVNFIVKAHPNFNTNLNFGNKDKDNLAEWDKKIYLLLKKRIRYKKNILFIDKPIDNKSLISKLNNKCLVITKHGSVQFEMVYYGFKVISSAKNMIDPRYLLTNSWSSRREYKNLLNKRWEDLNFADKNSFLTVTDFLFLNKNSHFGKNFYLNPLKNYMLKKRIVKKDSSYQEISRKFASLKNKNKVIDRINVPINNI